MAIGLVTFGRVRLPHLRAAITSLKEQRSKTGPWEAGSARRLPANNQTFTRIRASERESTGG
jgi:hypothetical protein